MLGFEFLAPCGGEEAATALATLVGVGFEEIIDEVSSFAEAG
jgi:hypothetical protein